ncbi:MAG: translin family protein [Thermoplasmata archaeon]|nr:MAG: translin family protein [Thermoplasmata archaeon]
MQNLNEIIDQIEKNLDDKDAIREVALKSCRAITRLSTAITQGVHRKEDVTEIFTSAREEATRLRSLVQEYPDLLHSGFVQSAFQELCEGAILLAVINNEEMPIPKELGVTDTSYLLGLADSIGELRRFTLECLRAGDVKSAETYLTKMEKFYEVLIRFDYPNALVSIRRKQDIARSLVEKTRGELAVAMRGRALEKKIEELEKKI